VTLTTPNHPIFHDYFAFSIVVTGADRDHLNLAHRLNMQKVPAYGRQTALERGVVMVMWLCDATRFKFLDLDHVSGMTKAIL